jgi:hypothetical protein
MWLTSWWRSLNFNAYDKRGNAKFLLNREADPKKTAVEGISSEVRDQALTLLCKSFNIHMRQMYCLRLDDDLMAIHRLMDGTKALSKLEFDSSRLALNDLPGPPMTATEWHAINTVEDLIRLVASRQKEK